MVDLVAKSSTLHGTRGRSEQRCAADLAPDDSANDDENVSEYHASSGSYDVIPNTPPSSADLVSCEFNIGTQMQVDGKSVYY